MLSFFGLNNSSNEALQKSCLYLKQKRLNEIIWLMINSNFSFTEAENLSLDERTYIINRLKSEIENKQTQKNVGDKNELNNLVGIKKGLKGLKFK